MDPQVGGSFIPKKAIVVAERRGEGVGLLFLIALFLFIASLVAAGAAFGYQQFLKSSIASKDQSLKLSEGAFDTGTIEDLVKLDSRLTQAQILLNSHVAPSALFDLLATLALPDVQFTNMTYTLNSDNSAAITVGGIAGSFSTVALESDQFGASKSLKDVVFSNIAVGQGGKVSFSISATVVPSVLSYRNRIANLSGTATTTP